MTRALAPAVSGLVFGALVCTGCGVSDSVLRDEQARSRKFREAWESAAQENKALKDKLAAQEARRCSPDVPRDEKRADASK
ncbi:MAG: hypothetical protein JST92_14395 [Deltaproteobacteria bacterium]|nr:hypothetical protein [Deltaproteobacteria bacterium]